MTKEDCIRKIAQKHYDIRMAQEPPLEGDSDSDWRYATCVFNFFVDVLAPRTSEWEMKRSDYEAYEEIYELFLNDLLI